MEYPKCVYAIQHKITKKIYIGVTNNLESRYRTHLSLLKNNKHNALLMQKEYNEHGGLYDVFILDEIDSYLDRYKEFQWMRYYKTQDEKYGYNAQDKGRMDKDVLPLKSGRPERMCDLHSSRRGNKK